MHNIVLLTPTDNTQKLITTTQNYTYDSQFFSFMNSVCIIWFLLKSHLYLLKATNWHYVWINGYGNNIWIVYFSAVLDNCSMPPNIVQEIFNDCNFRTIHFPIDHKNLNFHIVFLLSLAETFVGIWTNLVHIYTHTHTPNTQTYSLQILKYTPLIYPTFNLRL